MFHHIQILFLTQFFIISVAMGNEISQGISTATGEIEKFGKNAVEVVEKEAIRRPIAEMEKIVRQVSTTGQQVINQHPQIIEVIGTHLSKPIIGIVELISKPALHPAPIPGNTQEEMEQRRKDAQDALGIDSEQYYNFGVIGGTGVGKSSLINSIRGLSASDPGAAEVDEVECTGEIREYVYPQKPHIRLWDIPGAGAKQHPSETYFMDKKLYALDGLIVVFSERFLKVDIDVAKSARENNVPYLFLRTKADQAIDSKMEQKSMGLGEAKEELRKQVSEVAKTELEKMGMPPQEVCCVSTRGFVGTDEQKKYAMDEEKMMDKVVNAALARRR